MATSFFLRTLALTISQATQLLLLVFLPTADNAQEVGCSVDLRRNRALDGSRIRALDGYVGRLIAESEIEQPVLIPHQERLFVVFVVVVVITDEDCFLSHASNPPSCGF